MLIVTYDISDDKLRTKFSKFLEEFGYRLQYSVFKIKNSQRILDNIVTEIEHRYEKKFSAEDSVMIFQIPEHAATKTIKFGYAKDMDSDILIL